MKCQTCKSERVASASAHCSDLCAVSIGQNEESDYVPRDMGIGGGDDMHITYCLDCGQIQGKFPLPPCALEGVKEDE